MSFDSYVSPMKAAATAEARSRRSQTEFRACRTNLERMNFFIEEDLPRSPRLSVRPTKSDRRAVQLRAAGNVEFKERKYFEALDSYTESLAWAESPSVAALAYSNRSAALARIGLYRQCLADIRRAIKHGYPEESMDKLITRRTDVQRLLLLQNPSPELKNKTIPDCLDTQTDAKYGRHLTAKRDIEIGELLMAEAPLASVLTQDVFIYCSECNVLCYNPLPCDSCSTVLFCGKNCKQSAWSKHHKYLCCILDDIPTDNPIKPNLAISLKITIQIIRQLKRGGASKIRDAVQKLLAHTDKRSLDDVYTIFSVSSTIFYLLKVKTGLFVDYENAEDDFKELLPLVVQKVKVNGVLINRLETHPDKLCQVVSYARGLYLKFSVFNHSCCPNAFFYHDGPMMMVRALGTIKRGEQCFVAYRYSYSIMSKMERRTFHHSFYFTCTCRACEEDWPEVEDDEDDGFDKPLACVMLAQQSNDRELLQSLVPTFARRLKLLEKHAPVKGLSCLKQLVVDCYQTYDNPRAYNRK